MYYTHKPMHMRAQNHNCTGMHSSYRAKNRQTSQRTRRLKRFRSTTCMTCACVCVCTCTCASVNVRARVRVYLCIQFNVKQVCKSFHVQ